jgi:tRNA (guanine-N7-)-methyltransferase
MSFGLSRGKELDKGERGLRGEDLPPLPDDLLQNPEGAWIDVREWFEDPSLPFELEIGSGKGTFLVQQAEQSPGVNYLGIEWAREFWLYGADRLRRRGLKNVILLNADASEFVRWRMPSGIARVIHLYFPDPWPKSKHNRRRMVQDSFLEQAQRILVDGGELRVVTDHADYFAWMEEHFDRWSDTPEKPDSGRPFTRFEFERPASAREGEIVGTNFERKYRVEGRPFNAAVLKKKAGEGTRDTADGIR